MSVVTCFEPERVLALIEGRASARELDEAEAHLDECASCRAVVTQVSRAATQRPAFTAGHRVGRYELAGLLGAGATGQVYAAWDPELARKIAVKIVSDTDAGTRDRVLREARTMARLDHPNVIRVHEVGEAPEGAFVAMELVDGASLRAWTGHTWRARAHVLLGIARGLGAVHGAGVIHRDLKPDNVIIGPGDRACVGDFGLARADGGTTAGDAAAMPILATGSPATSIAGTPAYMAPEVLRGEVATAASDQFSFGVLAYELMGGRRPFVADTWKSLLAAIEGTVPPRLGDVPRWLDLAVRRCLAVDPAARFASTHELVRTLERRLVRRSPMPWLAAIAAAGVAASAITAATVGGGAGRPVTCDGGARLLATAIPPSARATLPAPARAALDRFSASWIAERNASCAAADHDSPATIASRDRCLDRRVSEVVSMLAHASTEASSRLVLEDALATLPPSSECALPGVMASEPVPRDPERAKLVADVHAALPAILAADAFGDARPVVEESRRVVELARRSEHAPTLAEALLARASVLRATSAIAAARDAAREAVAAAVRGHDDVLVARGWIARLQAAGDQRQIDFAVDAGAMAAAAIDRIGSPPHLVATLSRLRGMIAYNQSDVDTAREALMDAHARFRALAGARSMEVADVESALGSLERAVGRDLTAALRWHESALSIDREVHAPGHPSIGRDLHNIAGVLRLRGQLDDALVRYREAMAIEVASRGDRSVEVGVTWNSIGLVELERTNLTAAGVAFEQALSILAAADHGDRAFALHNLGLLALQRGDTSTALRRLREAEAVYAQTIGHTSAPALRVAEDLARARAARAERRRGNASSAVPVAPIDPNPRRPVGSYGSAQTW